MHFKKLEIELEGSWIKRKLESPHFKKTLIYTLAGGVIGFLFFFLSEGLYMNKMPREDILQSIIIGAGIGLFITNSPCARGRC